MGNRAVITAFGMNCGVYVHWDGDLHRILAFLEAAKVREYRDPSVDAPYALARLCGLIHEHTGTKCAVSVGIGSLDEIDCDNGDNGVYVIGKNWEIMGRYGLGSENKCDLSDLGAEELMEYRKIVRRLT